MLTAMEDAPTPHRAPSTADVIVVGAGATGLTAALVLARCGVHVRVLDAAPAPFPGPRGNGIQPRTLEVLDPQGVTDRLTALGTFALPVRAYAPDRSFQDRERNPTAETTPDQPFSRTLLLPQYVTERVLRERLAEFGVAVEQNCRVIGLSQDDDVVATLEDGRRLRGRYLVGADGGSSTIRRAMDIQFLGETTESTRLLLAEVELDGLDRDHWHQFDLGEGAESGFAAFLPLPATPTWGLQYGSPDPEAVPDEKTLRAVTDGILPRVRLRRIAWTSTWRLNVRMVDRYRVGRAFLAGDAAHVHAPAGGQGLNTGVQDAVNLGWKLAAVLGGGDEALLDTYEQERLPVAASILDLSSELVGGVLSGGLRSLSARPAALQRRALQLDLSYRTDPDEPGLRAGDRAPDSPLDGDTTLFIRRRESDWTLLNFGAAIRRDDAQVLDAASVDSAGELRRIYQPEDGERFLIRPDGHIGWRGRGVPPDPGTLAALGR